MAFSWNVDFFTHTIIYKKEDPAPFIYCPTLCNLEQKILKALWVGLVGRVGVVKSRRGGSLEACNEWDMTNQNQNSFWKLWTRIFNPFQHLFSARKRLETVRGCCVSCRTDFFNKFTQHLSWNKMPISVWGTKFKSFYNTNRSNLFDLKRF